MSFEQIVASIGWGDLVTDGVFAVEVGLSALTALLFFFSLVFCVLAYRAAKGARRARSEAIDLLQSAHVAVHEVRDLTAQAKKASFGAREYSDRLAARLRTAEAAAQTKVEHSDNGDEISLGAEDMAEADNEAAFSVEEEPRAKKRPTALLRGFMRRR